jgi:hypothetical protein
VAAIWVQIPKKFLSFGVHEVPFKIGRNSTSACLALKTNLLGLLVNILLYFSVLFLFLYVYDIHLEPTYNLETF